MRTNVRVWSLVCVLSFLVAISTTTFASVHTSASPKVRVTARVDNTKRTVLNGHVPAAVRRASDLGLVAPATVSEHMTLLLKSDENQKRELRRVLDEQQDKNTANFHQWLTPEEFGTHFGVHENDIAQVQTWLQSQGLTVDDISKSRREIHFSGTIGQVQNAFQVQMHYFLMPNGEVHVSNDRDISVPSALAPVIAGVPTLNNFFRKSHRIDGGQVSQLSTEIGRNSRVRPGPKYTSSTSVHYVSAGDFATIYNTAPLLAQGINGSGETIAIVGRSDILLSDVQSYRQLMGLSPNDPNFIHAGQDGGVLPGDDGESDLDVEISGGVAPGATVDFVIGTPTFLVDGITNSIEYIVENNIADVMSISYGDCEANEGAGGNAFNSELFEQAAAQGTSIFIAAGDNGPAECDDSNDSYEVLGYAAPAEASTWYTIAAGGSEFDEGSNVANYWSTSNSGPGAGLSSALTYIPEVPWNEASKSSYDPAGEDLSGLWSGSGMISSYYLQPPWQRGSGVPTTDPALTLANGTTGLWVTGITITNPGSGYTTAPTLTFSGGGCLTEPYTTGAVSISGGAISSITFPNDGTQGGTLHVGQGYGCTSAPTIAFTAAPSGGTTATATATVGQMQDPPPLISGVPHRYTPDLALNAASDHDGTFFCSEGVCEISSSGGLIDAGLVGGTSVAAPSMAGIQALIDQANGGRQGMPGYIFYSLAAAQSPTACNSSTPPAAGSNCAFQDITTGNNFICGESSCTAGAASEIGFKAAAGYDMATGLGSPNAANLASQWSNVTFNSSNTTLGLTNTNFQHGTSVTLSGTVAAGSGSGTPTGDVAFIVSSGAIGDTVNEVTGAMNGPVAFATLSGGTYSASLNNLPGGTYYVTARYAGDETYASSLSAPVQVVVSSENGGVTITPYSLNGTACTISPASSFTYGSDILINVNVAGNSGAGSPTGSVALTLDGNPWTTLTLDPNGNAYVLSGAVSDASCVYDYSYPNVEIPAGSHVIGATYSGDNSVATVSATPASITVGQISPGTLTVYAGGGTTVGSVITSGATIPLSVSFPTVSALTTYEPTPGASGPTGTVTFTDTTTNTVVGTATVVPTLVYENEASSTSAVPEWIYAATATTSTSAITQSGINAITASYSGDNNYTSATGSANVTVGGTTATTIAVTSSANPTTLAGTPTFTATVTTATAGTVTFYDGSTVLGLGSTVGTAHTSTLKVSATYPFVGGAHNITAVYSGTGTTSQSSTSPALVETVTQGTMSINLSARTTGSNAQQYSFAALLTCVSGGCAENRDTDSEEFSNVYTPSGNVNFYDGSTLLGSAPATIVTYEQGGYGLFNAQFTTSLAAGTHNITATYADTNYALATSNAQSITVGGTQSITFNTPAPSSAAYGSSFTVGATASSSLSVAYTSFGSCTNSGATYTMSKGTGSCLVIANQSGNSSYAAAPEVTESVAATIATTSMSTTVNPSSEDYGSTVPVTITGVLSWSGSGAAPTASDVTITGAGLSGTFGTTSCGAASGGIMTCTNTYTPSGTDTPNAYTMTATFSGDGNYSGSSQSTALTINGASSTTTVGSSPNPSTYAEQVTFTATITGENGNVTRNVTRRGIKQNDITGTVTWSPNTGCSASTVSGYPGVATCTTSSATHLPVGNDTVTATYSGDSNHSGSQGSVVQDVQGGIATTISVTSVSPSSENYGVNSPVTITAQLTWTGHGAAPTSSDITISGNGSGIYGATSCAARSGDTITCTATYTPTDADGAGSYNETAAFSGDTNYAASNSTQTGNFTINGASSTTTISSSGSSTYGQQVTFTATIDEPQSSVKGKVSQRGIKQNDVTGTVTWSANTGCSPSPVSGDPATASCVTSSLPGGTDTVTANYSGDSNNDPSSGSYNQTVSPASQTVMFSTNAPGSEAYNGTFTVAASASSGLAVTYGSSGSCSNSGATYTMTSGTGSCSVTASQAGNNDYSAATPVTEVVNATVATQSITVTTPAPPTATLKSSFTVVATATSGLPVTFGSSGGCTNSGSTYTMASTGKVACTVTMSQAGNGNYSAATGVTETTTVAAAVKPTVSFTGAPTTAPYQSSFTILATSNSASVPTITATGPCTISGSTVTMTSGVGSCSLKAEWAANDVYEAASATQHTTAEKIAPMVTFTGAPSSAAYLSTFTLATTENSGVTPKYSSTTGSVCSVSSGVVTMKSGTGTCTVKATWAANDYYLTTSLEQSTSATMLGTTTTITSTVPETNNALKVEVYFTVSNGTSTAAAGDVTVTAASGQTCTGSATTGKCLLTFTSAGSTTVTAAYAGNANNSTSTSAAYPLTVY